MSVVNTERVVSFALVTSLDQTIVENTQILEMVLTCYKRSEALSVKDQ